MNTIIRLKFPSIIFCVLINQCAVAQKQADWWFFADSLGIHFVGGEPIIVTDGALGGEYCLEGSSAISDSSGQLLFYCCAEQIYNRLHQLMPNGGNLVGGGSSTQGALIVPMPGTNHRFYVFVLDEFQNDLANGLNYYIVNMCLEDGLGDVESTPNFAGGGNYAALLLADAGEKQTATYHENGHDIWLVVRRHHSDEFYAYLITEEGINPPVISAIGWDSSDYSELGLEFACAIGQIKISPDGSKLAMVHGKNAPNYLQLFDFNNNNGQVSNSRTLFSENEGFGYSVAFSPDNTKLYYRAPYPTGLRQYDITLSETSQMISTAVDIPWNGSWGGSGMQLANNGKIYVSRSDYIGVIHNPNLAGSSCNFQGEAINLLDSTGLFSYYTLPGFIDSFNYHNGIPCTPDVVAELKQNDFIVLAPMPCSETLAVASSLAGQSFEAFRILNNTGQALLSVELKAERVFKYSIDISSLPEGIFYLELITHDAKKIYKKIVIKR